MLPATTQVEDFDRLLEIFSTKGAALRGRGRLARDGNGANLDRHAVVDAGHQWWMAA